jgi:hypothetical protein
MTQKKKQKQTNKTTETVPGVDLRNKDFKTTTTKMLKVLKEDREKVKKMM